MADLTKELGDRETKETDVALALETVEGQMMTEKTDRQVWATTTRARTVFPTPTRSRRTGSLI